MLIQDRLEFIVKAEKEPKYRLFIRLQYTEDGIKALLDLSHGDMRRVINILQATAMAYDSITGDNVYQSAGAPSPADIEFVLGLLLNRGFNEAKEKIEELRETKRFALIDIIHELVKRLQEISFPPKAEAFLYKELAELEYRLSSGTDEEIQLISLVGIFVKVRSCMS